MSIKAIHTWRIVPHGGRTLVRAEESFEGPVARLFKRSLQRTLEESLSAGLKDLKAEAEKRSAGKKK
jgi:hypothetical protein